MNTTFIGILNHNPIQHHHAYKDKPIKQVLVASRFKFLTFSQSEHLWSYLGKMVIITRHFLNAAARNIHIATLAGLNFSKIVNDISLRTKLLSIISVPFSLKDLGSVARNILNGLFLNDKESIALSTLSFTVISADILDSFTTFINSALRLGAATPIALFSAMGRPLGFTMAGLGTISRTIQIAKSFKLYRSIDRDVLSKKSFSKNLLKVFLENILFIDDELNRLLLLPEDQITQSQFKRMQQLKDNNKAAILRAAPSEALMELESLLSMLETNFEEPLDMEEQHKIIVAFERIQMLLIKKMRADGLSICANLFSIASLTLFSMGSLTASPFVLLTIAFSIRLGVVFYKDQKIKQMPVIRSPFNSQVPKKEYAECK